VFEGSRFQCEDFTVDETGDTLYTNWVTTGSRVYLKTIGVGSGNIGTYFLYITSQSELRVGDSDAVTCNMSANTINTNGIYLKKT